MRHLFRRPGLHVFPAGPDGNRLLVRFDREIPFLTEEYPQVRNGGDVAGKEFLPEGEAFPDMFGLREALLDQVWRYVALPEHCWTQQWRVGDLVIWDNRCVMHRRGAFDPASRRLMRRTQIRPRAGA